MQKNSQDKLAVLIIALGSLILYFNSLGNNFIFDDFHGIVRNLYIKDLRFLPMLFKGHYTSEASIPQGMFRPLLLVTFYFNYLFSGLKPFAYHLINILLHFLNGILLYSLFKALKKDLPFGLMLAVSLLFIAHPINTEAVNYISCRSDLLVSAFVLSAVISYINRRLVLSLILYGFALLTKESSLVFLPLILSYDFIFQKPVFPKQDKKRINFYIAVILISILYWWYRSFIFGQSGDNFSVLRSPVRSLYSNILTQSAVTLFYLKIFIFSYPLSIHHVFPELNSLFNPLAFISVFILIMLVVLAVNLRKKEPMISFGIAWFIISLLPKFYAILNVVAAEHHFYLAGFGIYLVLAVLLSRFYLRFRRQIVIALTGILLVFVVLVIARNYEWRDGFNLWRNTLKHEPKSAYALQSSAIEYLKRNEYAIAKKLLRKSILYSGRSPNLEINNWLVLASIYQKEGDFNKAENLLNIARNINPRHYRVHRSLGDLYMDQGKLAEAEKAWKECLGFSPYDADIQVKLGILYYEKNDLKRAKQYFSLATRSNPDAYLAFYGLGLVLEKEQDIAGAMKAYKEVIKLFPAHALSLYRLGFLYARKADMRSLWYFKQAVKFSPNFAEAHNDLAVLYASMEPPQMQSAKKHAQKALSLGYKVNADFLKVLGL